MNNDLEKALQTFESYFKNHATDKLSLVKKRDLVDQISDELQSLDRKQTISYQGRIALIAITMCNFPCGASIIRAFIDVLKTVYTNGDPSKLQTEFFDHIQAMLMNPKAANQTKITCCHLSSKIFKLLWLKTSTPPTKELIETYQKVNKNTQEKACKEAALKAIKTICKANTSNFFQIQAEVFKYISKIIGAEKIPEVKFQAVKCLRVFTQVTLNYSGMHSYFEQILTTCFKGFEDQHKQTREEYIQTLFHLCNLRLQESAQQGDFKQSFRLYNQVQKDQAALNKDKNKKQQLNLLDMPRTLSDMVSFFSLAIQRISFIQNQSNVDNMKISLAETIARLIENNKLHIAAVDIQDIMGPMLLSLSSKTLSMGIDAFKQREVIQWIVSQFIGSLDGQQGLALIQYLLQCLNQKKVFINKEIYETFSLLNKNQKLSLVMGDVQIVVILRAINEILFKSESPKFCEQFQSEKEIIDEIIPYIRDQQNPLLRLYAIEIVKTLGFKAPQWVHQLISIFLSFTTIQNANLAAMKQMHCLQFKENFIGKPESQAFHDQLNNLNALALTLSSLLTGITYSIKGVPLALINSTLNSAKTMIIGSGHSDEEGEEFYQFDLNAVDFQEYQRREAGWIILEGLIHQGNQWLGSKLTMVLKLWHSVFSKEMCVVNPALIKDSNYLEKILIEFKIKKQALSSLKCFLNKSMVLVNLQVLKLISSFLCNATTFFFNQDKDKKDVMKLFKNYFSYELQQVKSDLYECLLQLQPGFYLSKFVHLLHTVCEEITREDINFIPSIYKANLQQDDLKMDSSGKKSIQFHSQKQISQMKIQDDFFVGEKYLPLLRFDRPITQMKCKSELNLRNQVLNNSILLFCEIFASPLLNIKNKQQLIKHLIIHSSPGGASQQNSSPKKPSSAQLQIEQPYKVNKSISIAITMQCLSRSLQKKGASLDILQDTDMFSQIKLILKNCELSKDETMLKICADAYTMLHLPLAEANQSITDIILNEIEVSLSSTAQNEDSGKKIRAVCMLGSIIRHYEFDVYIKPVEQKIKNYFYKICKETNPVVRKFALHYILTTMKNVGFYLDDYYQTISLTYFHQMQTDIVVDWQVLANLGKAIDENYRQNEVIALDAQNKKSFQVFKEFVFFMFIHKKPKMQIFNKQTMCVSLDLIKTVLILDQEIIYDELQGIIAKVYYLLMNQIDLDIKMKALEVLAAFLYKGYMFVIRQEHPNLIYDLLDQLNQAQISMQNLYPEQRLQKKIVSSIDKILSQNEEFEKLINFGQNQNFGNEKILLNSGFPKSVIKPQIFRYNLKVAILFVAKLCANQDIQEWVDLTKYAINYQHTNKLQQYEDSKKPKQEQEEAKSRYIFNQNLTEHTKVFIIKILKNYIRKYSTLDIADKNNIRHNLSTMINLAFQIVSIESNLIKKSGLSLMILLVKRYSKCIEKVGDDDDLEDKQTQLRNPLVLEQYEANIYPIIRQNLIQGNASSKQLDPALQNKTFDLIFQFLTIPICKDPSNIGRIIGLLTEQLSSFQLAPADMYFYERIICETHFKKLILLSKLLIASSATEGEAKFKVIESNCKKIQEKSYGQMNNKSKNEQGISKFMKEDRLRIQEQFTAPIMKVITQHLLAALTDSYLILSMPKASLKTIKEFIFIKNGTRCAYNQEIIENCVQYFVKALTLVPEYEKRLASPIFEKNIKFENALNSILYFYIAKPIEFNSIQLQQQQQQQIDDGVGGGDPQNNICIVQYNQMVVYNYSKLKQFALEALDKLLINEVIKLNQSEINEYLSLFQNLIQFGVQETNLLIFQVLHYFLVSKQFMEADQAGLNNMLCQTINIAYQIHVQIQPFVCGDPSIDQDQRKNQSDYTKTEVMLLKSIFDFYTDIIKKINDAENIQIHFSPLLHNIQQIIYGKLLPAIMKIETEQFIKFYSVQILQQVTLLTQNKNKIQVISIGKQYINENITNVLQNIIIAQPDNKQSTQTLLLITQILIQIYDSDSPQQIRELITLLLNKNNLRISHMYIKCVQSMLQVKGKQMQEYSLNIFAAVIQLLSSILSDQQLLEKESKDILNQLIVDCFVFLLFNYSQFMANEQRGPICSILIALVFSIMKLGDQYLLSSAKQTLVLMLGKMQQFDQQVFLTYFQAEANQQEKQAIESLMRQDAAVKQGQQHEELKKQNSNNITSNSDNNSQTANKKQDSINQSANSNIRTSETQQSSPDQSKKQGGGSIKLTMKFKKN